MTRGLDHNSGTVTRRVSEEMLQVNTRPSLTRRVTVLSLLAFAGVMIKAVLRRALPAVLAEIVQFHGKILAGEVFGARLNDAERPAGDFLRWRFRLKYTVIWLISNRMDNREFARVLTKGLRRVYVRCYFACGGPQLAV